MTEKFPKSQLPIRKTAELLPRLFQTESNKKFMAGTVDPLVQPGVLEKTVGYVGRRFGKTYNSKDIYLDTDSTLRSRYQLEPAVVVKSNGKATDFYDYLDFKNQLKFFNNSLERDDLITQQEHYTWNPPIDWDKFVNYREYFWVPEGPPVVSISGIPLEVDSTYKVFQGTMSSWVFTPDGLSNNPTLTLYKGYTYKFKINSPGEEFFIRRSLDLGSSLYNPILPYSIGQVVVYDGKIYRATENISSQATPIPLDQDPRWVLVDSVGANSFIDYNNGVTNNGTSNGVITFEVPYDSPDILYYQSAIDPNRFGKFIIRPIEENTFIDINKDIIGKETYKSSNGVEFSNGLIVEFTGLVFPEKYSKSKWLVEGVGEEITLIEFSDLVVTSSLSTDLPEVLFDNEAFDSLPYDDATAYPIEKDYITIAKSSKDRNPWSRYNRWFHRSVLEFSHKFNNSSFNATEESRAKRPVIEFKSGIQLINHGSVAKDTVDYIDTFTNDVFSIVEGSTGYFVDGEQIFENARILFTNDSDTLVNNRIYIAKFIVHNGRRQISLIKAADSEPSEGQCVLIRRGKLNKGLMYHFINGQWIKSQEKNKVNQSPLFDIFDENDHSFSDQDVYPSSTFYGSEIVSYKIGNGFIDTELGFSLTYLNIDNVGDIQFEFDLEVDTFTYQTDQGLVNKPIATGFYRINNSGTYNNGWSDVDKNFVQPIIESIAINQATQSFESFALYWDEILDTDIKKILFFVNGIQIRDTFERDNGIFTFSRNFQTGDVVTIKVFADAEPNLGYYEIPVGLEKNPLNQKIVSFTLGQATDHVLSGIELDDDFIGTYPGQTNLRDINSYRTLSRKFLKHSGLTPLAMLLLCDKQVNIVKAIDYARNSYSEFKNNFIKIATTLPYEDNVSLFVDNIINEMSRSKNESSAFFGSDMIGSGAFTETIFEVEDEGIKTFVLSQKFDLSTISNRAVYVYLNDQQLLHGRDYTFNSTFGFIVLTAQLAENDQIRIKEYVSSANNFIPPTPTKLGLYKKFTPRKFLDDTYLEPREMIQGHDGSLTAAFGDFRDDLILELETRIYNNIKQAYNPSVFDNDLVVGGYYNTGIFSKTQVDSVMARDFLKWVSKVNVDYLDNIYFDSENPFTFTYSNMTDQEGTQNLPGWWRGVYQWFYDTDRPHRCPWEMLGFSEMPTWWEDEYGPAPYTKNNLILWEDLRDGVIRQGEREGIHQRYTRPTLLNHIPVDSEGKLLDPLNSGLAGNFVLINNRGTFTFGDISPVEYAWRSSSEYPFSIISALCLLKPFEFISDNFNKSNTVLNRSTQKLNRKSGSFVTISDLEIIDNTQASGLFLYLNDYTKGKAFSQTLLNEKIKNIDVLLSNRISGFVDKQQQRYLLDSKNPKSTSGNIFVPQENYDIIFEVSNPISSISYSGVIIEKVNSGWKISGYDSNDPYFNYYQAVPSQTDSTISIGGVTETFVNWASDKFYNNGTLVRFNNRFYRSIRSHQSGSSFDSAFWKQLPKVPVVGAVEALLRQQFNKLKVRVLSYGQTLTSIQEVVDFLLGYQEYQKAQGIKFNGYNTETQTAYDWITASKEFMFWTKSNWEIGSLLSLSPCADQLEINISLGVADNLLDGFYDYQVYKNDGTPLSPRFINVARDFQKVSISTVDTNDGIYFIKVYFVLKEHVVLFNDRTVFNDVIYDKPTGYRQDRIKVRGFRTVDWDGDYTSPGFIFDNVSIDVWQPFIDYRLGDIVAYKSFYWTSRFNHIGSQEFDETYWVKLDLIPEKGLVSNFDYRINQFEDYYEVDSDGVGSSQRSLARHAIGYQSREYLQNIAEDEVTQFNLYQGFIKEKGTINSVIKVFDKLSQNSDSIKINEEWAFKLGEFGGSSQVKEVEFTLFKDDFKLNPQPILIQETKATSVFDQYLRVSKDDFSVAPIPFTTNLNPLVDYSGPTRNAGYVRDNQVRFTVPTRLDIIDIDIAAVLDNDYFWITFDKNSWAVLRYNDRTDIKIVELELDSDVAIITTSSDHNLVEGEIVGIKNIESLTGFYQVFDVERRTFSVFRTTTGPLELDPTVYAYIGKLTSARYSSYNDIDFDIVPLLKDKSKLWIDANVDGKWEVLEKSKQYSISEINNYGVENPYGIGKAVVYNDSRKQVITSAPQPGYILVYEDRSYLGNNDQPLLLRQIVAPEFTLESATRNVFAEVLAISPDHKWLAAGSPLASGVVSRYLGAYNSNQDYQTGDIVLFSDGSTMSGKLWEAVRNVDGNGTINLDDWKPVSIVKPDQTGSAEGFSNQGLVTLYRYENEQWIVHSSILSPRQTTNEKFGSSISLSVDGTTYYMAVSAVGSSDNTGRVYLFYFNGTAWHILDNSNYLGVYSDDLSTTYPQNSVVWYNDKLWKAINNSTGGINITQSADWAESTPTLTQNILPSNPSTEDDGSILPEGSIEEIQLTELVQSGDLYGFSIATNRDASILVVGAPNSDGRFYSEYKGAWESYQTYILFDVVRYQGLYYRLEAQSSNNQIPNTGAPWSLVDGPEIKEKSGKIFVYTRDSSNRYNLIQSINANNLFTISDIPDDSLLAGDYFGYSLDLDWSGNTLVVSAPMADINLQDQGSVFVFTLTNGQYRLTQKLDSFEDNVSEMFGSSVSISPGSEQIIVGAKNSSFGLQTIFDRGFTIFDGDATRFFEFLAFSGQVYIFENKPSGFYLTEKLQAEVLGESFGAAVDSTRNVIVVGSPLYKQNNVTTGTIRLYRKDINTSSLRSIATKTDQVDLEFLENIILYDTEQNFKIFDIDVVDHYKLKILSRADREISFKTVYDPAIYALGTEQQVIDQNQAWLEKNVGKIWWDLSTVKFLNYEQGDVAYRIGNWSKTAVGSSIDIYEWVETVLLPSEWSLIADTTEGLSAGISGQPKHPDDTVYNTKVRLNPQTGQVSQTLYYYWVRRSSIVPTNNKTRRISAASISDLIENPITSGLPFIAFIDKDKFLAYNFKNYFESEVASINIQYKNKNVAINNIHSEYQLLTEGVADSLPSRSLETKWIDSLLGQDQVGNRVPDLNLPVKQKYGISFRPRQTMFVNRIEALKIVVNNINQILRSRPFSDLIDFTRLNSFDAPPDEVLNEYDRTVDSYVDLETVGTVRVKQAILSANIINGEIDTIDIVDPGFGYRTPPPVVINGTGKGAKAVCEIDNQGRVSKVTVTLRGKKYSSAIVTVRPFSVLVLVDINSNNDWGIYSWDSKKKSFYKSASQAFNTTKYWEYSDWWAEGYSEFSRISFEVNNLYEETGLPIVQNELLRVKEFASGGWAVLEKTADNQGNILSNYRLIGRQNGTFQIKDTAYDATKVGIGYNGSTSYDSVFYDLQNARELRIILDSIKHDVFVDDLRVEWNKLFFSSIRYAFSEQLYVNWAFKTSFLSAIHNVGELTQRVNYKNDNLDSYRSYLEEVKPFRTTIREYTSRYTRMENAPTAVSDFDLPPAYSQDAGAVLPTNGVYDRTDEYPWKWWADNNGYSIASIEIHNQGGDYTTVPEVVIVGNGQGAKARAYISNGKITYIQVIDGGTGYTTTPTVTIAGGNGNSTNDAQAVAILGNGLVRSFNTTIKFDRITKQGIYSNLTQEEQFVASGSSSVFQLKYAPSRDRDKIAVYRNQQIVLKNEYDIRIYRENNTLKGQLNFINVPASGEVISIEYEKNVEYFDSVNRIETFYDPASGMIGKELPQLMTGIDFGGVQVQGNTFDVTGGWDAIPWSVDNWDSVESNGDFYYVVNGNASTVTLPYVPENEQLISIYLKRINDERSVRIDDPYYNQYDDSTVQPNGEISRPQTSLMPSFIGDGENNVIDIGSYLNLNTGDTLIFRTVESDGAIIINDSNLLDTKISGGNLDRINNAYVTAMGVSAEEIVIDGEKFISPMQVPAPEENIPGQVLDSLSIKVVNATLSGAAPIQSSVYTADGITKVYSIGRSVFDYASIIVYVNKIRETNYSINFENNTVEFVTPPPETVSIEIISIGIGGTEILDYQEFISDGDTTLFLTKADFIKTKSVLVSVDGQLVDAIFINSSEFTDTKDKTLIQFGFKPAIEQVVKIICFSSMVDSKSLVRINQQSFIYDGSTRSFNLDTFVLIPNNSPQSAVLVDIENRQLNNVDTTYVVYDGTNSSFELGVDPEQPTGTITVGDFKVFVNNQLKSFIIDYTFDTNTKIISMVPGKLTINDIIKVEVSVKSQYVISGNELTILPEVEIDINDTIVVTWFDNYPSMDLISDQYAGGKIKYNLSRTPLSSDYVWVYKNGYRLTKEIDFGVSLSDKSVMLKDSTTITDDIKIVEFGEYVYRKPSVFEIFKDMLNITHYKRYSLNNDVKLSTPLNYYDQSIQVTDASELFTPVPLENIPGIIVINNERIEYFTKTGNILGQLRRGCQGTAIATVHQQGSYVVDISPSETIPYREEQEQINFISDGSTLLIGPLDFIPRKSSRSNWFRSEIPEEFGPCDELEIFVGGRRLRKDPMMVYNEQNGVSSPNSDIEVQAEFSVDGTTPYIRLTTPAVPGVRIFVIRKQGKIWYDKGEITASAGKTFLKNTNDIVKFVSEKTSEIPE